MIWNKKLWFIAPVALASALNAQNVVADWNAIGSATIVARGGKVPAASFVTWIGLQTTILIMGILYLAATLSLLVNPALKAMGKPLSPPYGKDLI